MVNLSKFTKCGVSPHILYQQKRMTRSKNVIYFSSFTIFNKRKARELILAIVFYQIKKQLYHPTFPPA